MSYGSLWVFCLDFAFIGILPRIFFRKDGSLNPMWWATAAPFILAPTVLVAAHFGYASPLISHRIFGWLREGIGVTLACASIALMSFTLGTHRIPIALWHQENDAPKQIVTWGAYRYLRHPFYASFLLALTGAVIVFPHLLTLVSLAFGYTILNRTAAREEKRLSDSKYGDEYKAYLKNTGRFTPKFG